ncbi:helix-turn-helix domain-containing protein [Kribbella albertanoniae]|uniref:Transcriptional regulator n=1 Tax=Kribbella albertanoniae TaxID=1266829 RepID=A0A4R4PYX7_9ACTN|nr:helix-turn-helix domain-containing protein [Kribbella albertanoniae]TDC27767.1 transcriptional regulator [Kribbella albertanoniae]
MTQPSTPRASTPLADLLLHPIRFRIVQRVLGREVTTTDLKHDLPDIPATTLYRHVAALIEGGMLTVVRERRIRGAIERTLTLDQAKAGRIGIDEARAMTPDQHRHALMLVLTQLAADFDRLVERGDLDTRLEQLDYNQASLYVDAADLDSLRKGIHALIEPYLQARPGKDRITWSIISLPDT